MAWPPFLPPTTESADQSNRSEESDPTKMMSLSLVSPASGVDKLGNLRRDFRVFSCGACSNGNGNGDGVFPSFLPKQIENIKDPFARSLAQRIQRLPVQFGPSGNCIMSSCVEPMVWNNSNPVLLLHCFDSSCLEWRYTYPLLEEAGLEAWAVDVLGWGFSDLERLPPCDVASKRHHLYQLWKRHIKRPVILVGPSLGAAVAIDFAVNYPEAVEKLVLIGASVYAEGTGNLSRLARPLASAAVSLLKSFPLRLCSNLLTYKSISLAMSLDCTNVGLLHCLLPWWKDATVDFMISGGYNVITQIQQVKQKTLIIWGEHDQIVSNKVAMRLQHELQDATIHQIPDCGHLPHVEKPYSVAKLIADFTQGDRCQEVRFNHFKHVKRPNSVVNSIAE